jgi:S1-C subfamily serine protease
MSTIYVPPVPAGPEGGDPGPWWPGQGGPGGPGGGGGGGNSGSSRPRWRMTASIAAVALVGAAAGSGIAWAAMSHTRMAATASSTLTTAQIAAKVSPALVDVNTTLGYQHGSAAGTGIVLTSSGEILTNNHVIKGATSITATDIGNGRTYQARVVGYDEQHDVAVLQLVGASGLKTATLGDSGSVRVGQRVVALGNAGGKGGAPSVVTGTVTALGQSIDASDSSSGTTEHLTGLIRSNAPIQAGDSGGALVNTAGQVIGMNTAGSTSSSPEFFPGFQIQGGQQGQPSETQAFAVPVSEATATARQIESGSASASIHLGATAFLGVGLTQANGVTGAPVVNVVTGSPAATAGLVAGDVIQSLGGTQITSPDDVASVLVRYHPGDRVTITWQDQTGQTHTATMVLGSGPAG